MKLTRSKRLKKPDKFIIGKAGMDYNGNLGIVKSVELLDNCSPDMIYRYFPDQSIKDLVSKSEFIVLVKMNDQKDELAYVYGEDGFYVP